VKDLAIVVERFRRMSREEARREFEQLTNDARALAGAEFAEALKFNAELATELRKADLNLWAPKATWL
jgi:hypothetical protein